MNNDAHLHLIVNHFPIIGVFFGAGILIAGMLLKNNAVKNTAYLLFFVAAIFTLLSMATGDGAEKMVEDLPSVGRNIIHEHEEMAEKLAIVLYLTAALSLIGLYLNIKHKAKANWMAFVVLTIAFVAIFLAIETGTSGGEIRHTEIRTDAVGATNNSDKDKE